MSRKPPISHNGYYQRMLSRREADDGTRRLVDMYCDLSNLDRVLTLVSMYNIIHCDEIPAWRELLYNYWVEICKDAAADYVATPEEYVDEHTHPLFVATAKRIYHLQTHRERGNARDYDPSTAGAPRRFYDDAYTGRPDSFDPIYNPF